MWATSWRQAYLNLIINAIWPLECPFLTRVLLGCGWGGISCFILFLDPLGCGWGGMSCFLLFFVISRLLCRFFVLK